MESTIEINFETILDNWELKTQYQEAIRKASEYNGDIRVMKTTVVVDAKGNKTETTEPVMDPKYAAIIAERDKMMAAAQAYRQQVLDELKSQREHEAAMAAASKTNPAWTIILPAVLQGLFGIGATALCIYGKTWFERNDTFDEGGVLNDIQKHNVKTLKAK